MDLNECIGILQSLSDPSTRKVYLNAGAKEPLFGVKMGDLRKLAKRIGIDHALALSLYASSNHDAMMLAGMICDPQKVTREILDQWIGEAKCTMVAQRCVAPLVAIKPDAWDIASAWTKSPHEMSACAGYTVYGMLFSDTPEHKLDLSQVRLIMVDIEAHIQFEQPYLQYAMNNCLIMAGIKIPSLSAYCLEIADRIGYIKPTIKVNNCNIQSASDYIRRYAPHATT
jgi:3-methyladenine DNA glycosylase AlkD